jgi:nucleoside-diphosphate-sugar epimerase
MAKILVTGGAGFIGSHLVRELRSRGSNMPKTDKYFKKVYGVGERGR